MRIIVLPNVENRTIVSSYVWTKHRNVTDGRTDGQTESLWLLQRSALWAMRTRCKNASVERMPLNGSTTRNDLRKARSQKVVAYYRSVRWRRRTQGVCCTFSTPLNAIPRLPLGTCEMRHRGSSLRSWSVTSRLLERCVSNLSVQYFYIVVTFNLYKLQWWRTQSSYDEMVACKTVK